MAPKKKETQVADVPFQQVSCGFGIEYAFNVALEINSEVEGSLT